MAVIYQCLRCSFNTPKDFIFESHQRRHVASDLSKGCLLPVEKHRSDYCSFKSHSKVALFEHFKTGQLVPVAPSQDTAEARKSTSDVNKGGKGGEERRRHDDNEAEKEWEVNSCCVCGFWSFSRLLLQTHLNEGHSRKKRASKRKASGIIVNEEAEIEIIEESVKTETLSYDAGEFQAWERHFKDNDRNVVMAVVPPMRRQRLSDIERSDTEEEGSPNSAFNYYKCSKCDYIAKEFTSLWAHLRQNHKLQLKRLPQSMAEEEFDQLSEGGGDDEGSDEFRCPDCSFVTDSSQTFEIHFKCLHGSSAVPERGEVEATESEREVQQNTDCTFRCFFCSFQGSSQQCVNLHASRAHGICLENPPGEGDAKSESQSCDEENGDVEAALKEPPPKGSKAANFSKQRILRCWICTYSHSNAYFFNIHVLCHNPSITVASAPCKPLSCSRCNFKSYDASMMGIHEDGCEREGRKRFSCEYCSFMTSRLHFWEEHLGQHLSVRCTLCGFTLRDLNEYITHVKHCDDKTKCKLTTAEGGGGGEEIDGAHLHCGLCEFCTIEEPLTLSAHLALEHDVYVCAECGYNAMDQSDLHCHLNCCPADAREKTSSCKTSKEDQPKAIDHEPTQQNVPSGSAADLPAEATVVAAKPKRFQCFRCDFSTRFNKMLLRHFRQNHVMHRCKNCNATMELGEFSSHKASCPQGEVQAAESQENQNPNQLVCGTCSFSTTQLRKNRYVRHLWKAHRQKLYECRQCPFTSTDQHVFSEHILVNHNFICTGCDSIFTKQDQFKEHKCSVGTSEKPFPCKLCAFGGHSRKSLAMHTVRRHKRKREEKPAENNEASPGNNDISNGENNEEAPGARQVPQRNPKRTRANSTASQRPRKSLKETRKVFRTKTTGLPRQDSSGTQENSTASQKPPKMFRTEATRLPLQNPNGTQENSTAPQRPPKRLKRTPKVFRTEARGLRRQSLNGAQEKSTASQKPPKRLKRTPRLFRTEAIELPRQNLDRTQDKSTASQKPRKSAKRTLKLGTRAKSGKGDKEVDKDPVPNPNLRDSTTEKDDNVPKSDQESPRPFRCEACEKCFVKAWHLTHHERFCFKHKFRGKANKEASTGDRSTVAEADEASTRETATVTESDETNTVEMPTLPEIEEASAEQTLAAAENDEASALGRSKLPENDEDNTEETLAMAENREVSTIERQELPGSDEASASERSTESLDDEGDNRELDDEDTMSTFEYPSGSDGSDPNDEDSLNQSEVSNEVDSLVISPKQPEAESMEDVPSGSAGSKAEKVYRCNHCDFKTFWGLGLSNHVRYRHLKRRSRKSLLTPRKKRATVAGRVVPHEKSDSGVVVPASSSKGVGAECSRNENSGAGVEDVLAEPEVDGSRTGKDEGLFMCGVPGCSFSAHVQVELLEHLRSAHVKKKQGNGKRDLSKLEERGRLDPVERKFNCKYCDFSSFVEWIFCDHINTYHPHGPPKDPTAHLLKCTDCPFTGYYRASLASHKLLCQGTPTVTAATISSGSPEKNKDEGGGGISTLFKCEDCGFTSYKSNKCHRNSLFNCSNCSKEGEHKLTRHISICSLKENVGEKSQNEVDESELQPEAEFPKAYACKHCNFTSCKKSALSNHLRYRHTLFSCFTCSQEFFVFSDFTKHVNSDCCKNGPKSQMKEVPAPEPQTSANDESSLSSESASKEELERTCRAVMHDHMYSLPYEELARSVCLSRKKKAEQHEIKPAEANNSMNIEAAEAKLNENSQPEAVRSTDPETALPKDEVKLDKKKEKTPKTFKCTSCDFKSGTAAGLKQHIRLKHAAFDKAPDLQCELCTFKTRYTLHMWRHRFHSHGINKKKTDNPSTSSENCMFVTGRPGDIETPPGTNAIPLEDSLGGAGKEDREQRTDDSDPLDCTPQDHSEQTPEGADSRRRDVTAAATREEDMSEYLSLQQVLSQLQQQLSPKGVVESTVHQKGQKNVTGGEAHAEVVKTVEPGAQQGYAEPSVEQAVLNSSGLPEVPSLAPLQKPQKPKFILLGLLHPMAGDKEVGAGVSGDVAVLAVAKQNPGEISQSPVQGLAASTCLSGAGTIENPFRVPASFRFSAPQAARTSGPPLFSLLKAKPAAPSGSQQKSIQNNPPIPELIGRPVISSRPRQRAVSEASPVVRRPGLTFEFQEETPANTKNDKIVLSPKIATRTTAIPQRAALVPSTSGIVSPIAVRPISSMISLKPSSNSAGSNRCDTSASTGSLHGPPGRDSFKLATKRKIRFVPKLVEALTRKRSLPKPTFMTFTLSAPQSDSVGPARVTKLQTLSVPARIRPDLLGSTGDASVESVKKADVRNSPITRRVESRGIQVTHRSYPSSFSIRLLEPTIHTPNKPDQEDSLKLPQENTGIAFPPLEENHSVAPEDMGMVFPPAEENQSVPQEDMGMVLAPLEENQSIRLTEGDLFQPSGGNDMPPTTNDLLAGGQRTASGSKDNQDIAQSTVVHSTCTKNAILHGPTKTSSVEPVEKIKLEPAEDATEIFRNCEENQTLLKTDDEFMFVDPVSESMIPNTDSESSVLEQYLLEQSGCSTLSESTGLFVASAKETIANEDDCSAEKINLTCLSSEERDDIITSGRKYSLGSAARLTSNLLNETDPQEGVAKLTPKSLTPKLLINTMRSTRNISPKFARKIPMKSSTAVLDRRQTATVVPQQSPLKPKRVKFRISAIVYSHRKRGNKPASNWVQYVVKQLLKSCTTLTKGAAEGCVSGASSDNTTSTKKIIKSKRNHAISPIKTHSAFLFQRNMVRKSSKSEKNEAYQKCAGKVPENPPRKSNTVAQIAQESSVPGEPHGSVNSKKKPDLLELAKYVGLEEQNFYASIQQIYSSTLGVKTTEENPATPSTTGNPPVCTTEQHSQHFTTEKPSRSENATDKSKECSETIKSKSLPHDFAVFMKKRYVAASTKSQEDLLEIAKYVVSKGRENLQKSCLDDAKQDTTDEFSDLESESDQPLPESVWRYVMEEDLTPEDSAESLKTLQRQYVASVSQDGEKSFGIVSDKQQGCLETKHTSAGDASNLEDISQSEASRKTFSESAETSVPAVISRNRETEASRTSTSAEKTVKTQRPQSVTELSILPKSLTSSPVYHLGTKNIHRSLQQNQTETLTTSAPNHCTQTDVVKKLPKGPKESPSVVTSGAPNTPLFRHLNWASQPGRKPYRLKHGRKPVIEKPHESR